MDDFVDGAKVKRSGLVGKYALLLRVLEWVEWPLATDGITFHIFYLNAKTQLCLLHPKTFGQSTLLRRNRNGT